MSAREVNEIADTPRGVTADAVKILEDRQQGPTTSQYKQAAEEAVNAAPGPSRSVEQLTQDIKGTSQSVARITKDGNVVFEKPDQKS